MSKMKLELSPDDTDYLKPDFERPALRKKSTRGLSINYSPEYQIEEIEKAFPIKVEL